MRYQDKMAEVSPTASQREPCSALMSINNLYDLLGPFGEVV